MKEEALGPLCVELALENIWICLKTDYELNEWISRFLAQVKEYITNVRGWSEKFSASTINGKTMGKNFFP